MQRPAAHTQHAHLLCQCVRINTERPDGGAQSEPLSVTDWPALLELAESHGVTDLVLPTITRGSVRAPSRVIDHLQRREFEAVGLNLKRAAQLSDVLTLLHSHNIRALTFKGPTFAAAAFGHLGRRVSNDIDVLVDRRDMLKVRPVLMARGYTLPPRVRHRAGSLIYGLLPDAGRDDTLYPPEDWQTSVDVHASFAFWPLGIRLKTRDLFGRAILVDIAGRSMPTLAAEDMMLVAAIHGMMHGWSFLRHVCDVDGIATKVTNWNAVVARAEAARMRRMLWVAILLAHRLLGAAIPTHVVDDAMRDAEAVSIATSAHARMFDPATRDAEWDPRPWHMRFLDRPSHRVRFHVRTFIYEWYLKWPWDEWLGRRGTTPA